MKLFNRISRGCLLSRWMSSSGRGDDDGDGDLAANALIIFGSNSRFHIVLHMGTYICWYWCWAAPAYVCMQNNSALVGFFFCYLQIIFINSVFLYSWFLLFLIYLLSTYVVFN